MNSSMIKFCFENRGPVCKIPVAGSLPSNDSIAGPATVYPFLLITVVCFLGSFFSVISRYRGTKDESAKDFIEHGTIWSTVVFSLSTVQLTSSIAYSLAALRVNSISAYHYNVVCYLGITALFTSAVSMLAPYSHIRKSGNTIARLILILMSLILLGILLKPRFNHFETFPGRAPPNHKSNDTALVLQASCLFDLQGHLNSAVCAFPNDRNPIWVMADILFLIPFCILLIVVGAICNTWGEIESGSSRNTNWSRKRVLVEILVIASLAVCASIPLWECFALRNWMNTSRLLADGKEKAIISFGAVVPFFMMIGTTLLLTTTALDELSEKRQKLRLQKKLPEDDSGIELPNFSAGGQSRHD